MTEINLTQLRTDIIEALTKIETEITALQYALLGGERITPQRLEQLQQAAEFDAAKVRAYFERTLRQVP